MVSGNHQGSTFAQFLISFSKPAHKGISQAAWWPQTPWMGQSPHKADICFRDTLDTHPDQITLPVSWEICMLVKKQWLDWFQIRKGVSQRYILSPCLFNLYAMYIMKNARLWMNQKLESRFLGEKPIISDMQMTLPL